MISLFFPAILIMVKIKKKERKMIGVLFLCYLVVSFVFTLPYIVRYLRICRLENGFRPDGNPLESDLGTTVKL